MRACAEKIGVAWPGEQSKFYEEMNQFICPGLNHSISDLKDLKCSNIPYPVIELFEIMEKLIAGETLKNRELEQSIDRLAKEFLSYSTFFRNDLPESRKTKINMAAERRKAYMNSQEAVQKCELELKQIHSSLTWEIKSKYKRVVLILFPMESWRREFYSFLVRNFKLIIHEGWVAFFKEPKKAARQAFDEQFFSYKKWIKRNEPNVALLRKMEIETKSWDFRPLISIVTPVYNPRRQDLLQCIQSVVDQIYGDWELCIIDGGSEQPYVKELIESFAQKDSRIKYLSLSHNHGIAGNSNEALKMATGEFVGLLDHDDMLAPFALYEVVKFLNENPKTDFLFSDEDKVPPNGEQRYDPFFKPDWSPDTFLSYNYACHFAVIRKNLIEDIGGFREGYDGAQDYDLILRIAQKTSNIKRIPKILYHWRASRGSVASDQASKYAHLAAKKTDRCGKK